MKASELRELTVDELNSKHQELKEELKIGITIQEYYKLVMLELEQQPQDFFQAKISKDLLLVHYSVFLCLMTMIPQINIMKETYLNQRQIYL